MGNEARDLVSELAKWLKSWIVFRRDTDALVCALWALNTWVYTVFDAVPYLCISAATKGAGKTALLECVSLIAENGKLITDPTASTLYRTIEAYRQKGQPAPAMMIDEAEKLNKETNDCRPALNSGYRSNGTIPRTMADGTVGEFCTFGPKGFALIGDLYDTLRDRSIVVRLVRSAAVSRRYRYSAASAEAKELVFKIRRVMKEYAAGVTLYEAEHLTGRDEEIWLPILSLGKAILGPKEFESLLAASADMTAEKTDAARSFIELRAAAEKGQTDTDYAERALVDLVSVLKVAEREGYNVLPSEECITRMRAIPTGPWRTFKGEGLTVHALSSLLDRFGLEPKVGQIKRGKGSKEAGQRRGYSLARALAASEGAGVK